MIDSEWQTGLRKVLDDWASDSGTNHVIISPDVDGLASAAILNSMYELKIIGIYTTTHLLMLDDYDQKDAKKALWLDHDVSQIGVRSVGQHLVHHMPTDKLPLREPDSWNPNVWLKQSWSQSFSGVGGKKRDKYPFGTAHFLWDLENRRREPTPEQTALLAHADGTWFALDCYKSNASIWKELMFSESKWTDNLLNYRQEHEAHPLHQQLADELNAIGYSSQSRSPKAQNLPSELKGLTGRQSLTIRIASNPRRYLERIQQGLDLIGGHMNSTPEIGTKENFLLSGKRELLYPNRIEDFDALMVEEKIFSHAFTDLRSLSYTVNLQL
jgi:hypothetical protein